MKRISFLLAIVLITTCLTACKLFEKNTGVTCQEYENCAVFTFDNFPVRGTASFELTRTGLGEGAIYYQINLEQGALGISYKDNVLGAAQSLDSFTADDEMPINGSGGYIEGDKIEISFGALSPVKGEIIIAFTENAMRAVKNDWQLHEHTYNYTSNEYTHQKIYTCGCPTPDIAEMHSDFDEDNKCDACGYALEVITDIEQNHFLRNQTGCEWLGEINADDIAQIEIVRQGIGVAPGSLKQIYRSDDETTISTMFERYYWLDTKPMAMGHGIICGGVSVTVTFTMKDGTENTIYIRNGNYYDIDGNCFDLIYIPNFEEGSVYESYSGFTAYGTGTVMYDDGSDESYIICEIPMSEIEFKSDVDFELTDIEPYNKILETGFCVLVFVTPDVFYIDSGIYCELVNTTLDELIIKYSNTDNI